MGRSEVLEGQILFTPLDFCNKEIWGEIWDEFWDEILRCFFAQRVKKHFGKTYFSE